MHRLHNIQTVCGEAMSHRQLAHHRVLSAHGLTPNSRILHIARECQTEIMNLLSPLVCDFSVMIGPDEQRECLPFWQAEFWTLELSAGDVVYLTPRADPLFPLWPSDVGMGLPQQALSV